MLRKRLWKNDVRLQYDTFDKSGKKFIELKASSPKVKIKYTTDGSSPKESGGVYDDSFELPAGTKFVQAVAVNEELGIFSDVIQIAVKDTKIEIDKEKRDERREYIYEMVRSQGNAS